MKTHLCLRDCLMYSIKVKEKKKANGALKCPGKVVPFKQEFGWRKFCNWQVNSHGIDCQSNADSVVVLVVNNSARWPLAVRPLSSDTHVVKQHSVCFERSTGPIDWELYPFFYYLLSAYRFKFWTLSFSFRFVSVRITCFHLPFQSKWLYVGTERGNVHIVNIESFSLSGYVINWNKAIEL